jgi:uncharacterized Fe-S cluster protein YjdI/CDGSH-type Zn-finger protein
MRKTYRGKAIEVSFDLDRCIHIGECLRGQPEVFDARRRPWIAADADDPDVVAEVIHRCPSGALQYRRLDGADGERHAGTIVTPVLDGPLLVVGDIEVTLEDGSVEKLPRAALCRCGQSRHKPFCDNTHLEIGFEAPGRRMRIHLTPVRPALREPVSREQDPRRE